MGGTGVIDNFLGVFTSYIDSGFGLLGGEVAFIATTLIVIDVTLAALFWSWSADDDIIARLVKKTLFVGVFAYLIGNWNNLAQIIFDSFAGLGLKGSGTSFSAADLLRPGKVAQTGLDAGRPLLESISDMMGYWSFFENFIQIACLMFAWVLVLLAFFILAVQLFVTLIEFKLTTLAGFVLIPFGLFGKTAFMAERVLGNVISSGIKVLVLAVIIGIGSTLTALGDTPVHGLDGTGYAALGKAICDAIGEIVGAKLPEGRTPYHELVSWVSGTQRAHPVEIFTTNYDLLIESAFEQAKAPYFDGFAGGQAPFFDPVTVAGNDLPPRWSRVWKLHGSLGWKSDSGTVVRCGGTDCTELVYPDHLKYDLTQKQPYAALFERLKRFLLTPDTVLLTTGFSFRDAHICAVLGEALAMNANAAVIALQFQTLAEEEPARKLAFEHPNLSVYASDAAVVGGIPGQWRLGDLPKNWGEIRSSFWGKRGSGDAFLLGDFASFSRFCALSYSPDLARPIDASVPIDGTDPTAVSA